MADVRDIVEVGADVSAYTKAMQDIVRYTGQANSALSGLQRVASMPNDQFNKYSKQIAKQFENSESDVEKGAKAIKKTLENAQKVIGETTKKFVGSLDISKLNRQQLQQLQVAKQNLRKYMEDQVMAGRNIQQVRMQMYSVGRRAGVVENSTKRPVVVDPSGTFNRQEAEALNKIMSFQKVSQSVSVEKAKTDTARKGAEERQQIETATIKATQKAYTDSIMQRRQLERAAAKEAQRLAKEKKALQMAASGAERHAYRVAGNLMGGLSAEDRGNLGRATPDQLANIEKLKRSMAQAINVSGMSQARAQQIFAKPSAYLATNKAMSQVAATSIKLKTAIQQLGVQNKNTTDGMLLSWQNYLRYFVTHSAYTAMFRYFSMLKEGFGEALDITRKVGEIQTLAVRSGDTLKGWSETIREVSDRFGHTSADVAESAYEALSNQIAQTRSEFVGFVSDLELLAKSTLSTSQVSGDYLASILNAFDMPVEKSYEVAAKAFKIVDLGRVRLGDMANTLGRIAVLANQLNVSYDEMGAAITVMTRRGVKYNEAATWTRNVMLKLIKPTDTMKKFFKSIGVESGEAAISTYGFAGTLAELEKFSAGSSTELGKLWGTIRAITGGTVFIGQGLKQFNSDIAEIQNNSFAAYNRAAETVLANPAEVITREWQRFKNFFVFDVGQPIVKWLAEMVKGGATFSKVIGTATVSITTASASLLMYLATTGALWSKIGKMFKGLALMANPFGIVAAAAGIAITAWASYYAWQKAKYRDHMNEMKLEDEKRLQYTKELLAKEDAAFSDSIGQRTRLYAQALADQKKLVDPAFDKKVETYKTESKEFVSSIEKVISAVGNQISKISSAISKAVNDIKDSSKKIQLLRQQSEQDRFDFEQEYRTPSERQAAAESRIRDLQRKAENAAGTGNIEGAREYYQQAKGLLKEIMSLEKDRHKAVIEAYENEIKKQKSLLDNANAEAKAASQAGDSVRARGLYSKANNIERQLDRYNRRLTGQPYADKRRSDDPLAVMQRDRAREQAIERRSGARDSALPYLKMSQDLDRTLERMERNYANQKKSEIAQLQAEENRRKALQTELTDNLTKYKDTNDKYVKALSDNQPEESVRDLQAEIKKYTESLKSTPNDEDLKASLSNAQKMLDTAQKETDDTLRVDLENQRKVLNTLAIKAGQPFGLVNLSDISFNTAQTTASMQAMNKTALDLHNTAKAQLRLDLLRYDLEKASDKVRKGYEDASKSKAEALNRAPEQIAELRKLIGETGKYYSMLSVGDRYGTSPFPVTEGYQFGYLSNSEKDQLFEDVSDTISARIDDYIKSPIIDQKMIAEEIMAATIDKYKRVAPPEYPGAAPMDTLSIEQRNQYRELIRSMLQDQSQIQLSNQQIEAANKSVGAANTMAETATVFQTSTESLAQSLAGYQEALSAISKEIGYTPTFKQAVPVSADAPTTGPVGAIGQQNFGVQVNMNGNVSNPRQFARDVGAHLRREVLGNRLSFARARG